MSQPPWVHRDVKANGVAKYTLVEPCIDQLGRGFNRVHKLGVSSDPREALAGMIARLRERQSWAGHTPSEEEAREIAVAQEKIDALTIAIAKMAAKG